MVLTPTASQAVPVAPRPESVAADAGQDPGAQALAGAQRYLWRGRFGVIEIEVVNGRSFVNGQLVEPVPASVVDA